MGCKRLASIFLLSFLVCSILPLTVNTQEVEEPKTFGNMVIPTVANWTKFWQLFNAYSDWDLEYNNGSGWISDKSQLQVIKNYTVRVVQGENSTITYLPANKSYADSVKITLNFTASYTADYRLTFAINLDVKNYIHKESSWNYTISYKNYTVFFDWSDLKGLPLDNVAHGIAPIDDESYFWFRIRKNNISQGLNFVVDPTFGKTTLPGAPSNYGIDNKIVGSLFTCPEDLTVDKITPWLRRFSGGSWNISCLIYNHTDLSLVSRSTERTIALTEAYTEYDFVFGAPVNLLNGEGYILCVWTEDAGGTAAVAYETGAADQLHYDSHSYNGEPNPMVPVHEARETSIYITYSVGGQELSFPLFENINVLSSVSKTMELSNTLFQNVIGWSSLTTNKEKGFSLFENILLFSSASRGIELARSFSGTVNVWSSLATATEGIAQDLAFTLFETVMPLAVLISTVAEAYVLADALALAAIAFVLAIVAICLLFAFKKES